MKSLTPFVLSVALAGCISAGGKLNRESDLASGGDAAMDSPDLAGDNDLAVPPGADLAAPPADLSVPDLSTVAPDLSAPDLVMPDLARSPDLSRSLAVVSFAVPLTNAGGSCPLQLSAADLDKDGKVDVVVPGNQADVVYFYKGNGDGTLALSKRNSMPFGYSPQQSALGDFNGDGLLDVVVSDNGSNYASLYTQGAGFDWTALRTDLLLADGPYGLGVLDINGDGKPDIAGACRTNSELMFALDMGGGQWTPSGPVLFAGDPIGLATADFDGDRHADLIVANATLNNATIYWGQGSATLVKGPALAAGSSPAGVTSADLNADGRPDIVIPNFKGGDLSVLLNLGGGSFGPAISYATTGYPVGVAVADFNLDGKQDLAVGTACCSTVDVFLGYGDGTFQPARPFSSGASTQRLAAADMNNDGKPDLVVPNCNDNNIAVLLNTTP